MLLSCLAVLMGLYSMLFRFLVFALFVVMNSLAVVVRGRFVMSSRIVVVLTGRVFHGHEMVLSKEIKLTQILQQRRQRRLRTLRCSKRNHGCPKGRRAPEAFQLPYSFGINTASMT